LRNGIRLFFMLCGLLTVLMLGQVVGAQDDTSDADSGQPTSTVEWFFVACESQAVLDLSGTMDAGFDLYVQIFSGLSAEGTPLTSLQQVSVDGAYTVSPSLPYSNGQILALGQFATARITIAAEGNIQNSIYSGTVDDAQDGCVQPAFPTTSASAVTTTPGGDSAVVVNGGTGSAATDGIFTPDGDVLFLQDVDLSDTNAAVVIGARPSEDPQVNTTRTNKPGFVFAECNDFPISGPGTLYDTDSLTVFWSWFASTPEQVQDHINNAQYKVTFWSRYWGEQTFSRVNVTDIIQREDGNFWVFYFVNLGPGFKIDRYSVQYEVTWAQPIFDGFDNYGPGTENVKLNSACDFTVELNPFAAEVPRPNPTTPLPAN
jgi:hypothetical protein